MSAGAALALQKAVYDRLQSDAVLTGRLGGARVYDAVPRNTAAPYVRLSDMRARDYSTSTETGSEITFTIIVWSREDGAREALEIAARIDDLIHDVDLPVEGYALINLRRVSTEASRGERLEGRRVRLRFRAVLQT